jgi:hypothetical protein
MFKLHWTHCHDEWLNRNSVLNGTTQQALIQARLDDAQFRILVLYNLRHLPRGPHVDLGSIAKLMSISQEAFWLLSEPC